MQYLTDRKRAQGLGTAKSGTGNHWSMTVSSVGLLILVPLFIFTFGPILGEPYEAVVAYYARPFPAVVAALTISVSFMHFHRGAKMMIEDYAQGFLREALILGAICLSYAAAATGLFALVRLAL